jgi:ferredoxin--NADP+ reductase
VIPNQGGRVTEPEGGEQVPGQYAVGWIKRGPSGVIGTNKKDAQETVDNLVEDARAGRVPTPDLADDPSAIVELLADRAPDSVTYAGWEAIDRAERERGEPLGRPRIKFVRIDEMLEAARAGVPSSAGG